MAVMIPDYGQMEEFKGQLPSHLVELARERRDDLVLALKENRLEDASDLVDPGKEYEDTNEQPAFEGLMMRLASSIHPEVMVPSSCSKAFDHAHMDEIMCYINLLARTSIYTMVLQGCPMPMRANLLACWIHVSLSLFAFNPWLIENPSDEMTEIGCLNLLTLFSHCFAYPAVCDTVVTNIGAVTRSLLAQVTEQCMQARSAQADPPSKVKEIAYYFCLLRVALGQALPDLKLKDPFHVYIEATQLPTTSQRHRHLTQRSNEKGGNIQGFRGGEAWTCVVCGLYKRVLPTEKRTETRIFKTCSYCEQAMYCSKACQIRDWKELDHRALCSRIVKKKNGDTK